MLLFIKNSSNFYRAHVRSTITALPLFWR